jgi:hypothetical protein
VEGSLSAVDPGAGTTIYRGALTEEPCFELVFRPWLIPPGVQIATGLFVIGGGICRWLRFNYIKPGGFGSMVLTFPAIANMPMIMIVSKYNCDDDNCPLVIDYACAFRRVGSYARSHVPFTFRSAMPLHLLTC